MAACCNWKLWLWSFAKECQEYSIPYRSWRAHFPICCSCWYFPLVTRFLVLFVIYDCWAPFPLGFSVGGHFALCIQLSLQSGLKFVSAEALYSYWTSMYASFLVWHQCEVRPWICMNAGLGLWYLLEDGKHPGHFPQASGWSYSHLQVVAETVSPDSQAVASALEYCMQDQ